jgi:hypothetical protein
MAWSRASTAVDVSFNTAMPVSKGKKVMTQVIMSSAVEILWSTGSVRRNSKASSRDIIVAPAATYITASGKAGHHKPVKRWTNAMCGA